MSEQNLTGRATATSPVVAVHPSAKAFKVAAIAEACSWVGLLIGMFFKWVLDVSEIGVKVFGPIHGAIFICYVLVCLWAASVHKWTIKQLALGLVSSIPPFMTIWFERFAERHGLLESAVARRTSA